MTKPEEVPSEIWDAVVDVATLERTWKVSKRDHDTCDEICKLIGEVVAHIYPLIREQA